MVEFRKNASRESLYELAVKNGISVPQGADRDTIIKALTAYNTQGVTGGATEGENAVADGGWADDTTGSGEAAQRPADDGQEGTSGAGGGTEIETPTGGATEGAGTGAADSGTDDTSGSGEAAQRPVKGAEEYDTYAYAGPTIPNGRLKENAVFRGKLSDVLEYLADVVEDYPQVPRLIVPTSKLAAFSVKVKTPGNIAHKYYNEILSAVRAKRKRGVTNG